jgi:hypothetical protein
MSELDDLTDKYVRPVIEAEQALELWQGVHKQMPEIEEMDPDYADCWRGICFGFLLALGFDINTADELSHRFPL